MRIITKLMLALAVVGSLSLTACKDYDEDNYNNAVINNPGTVDDALKQQIAAMQEAIKELKEKSASLGEAVTPEKVTESIKDALENNGDVQLIINNYITQSTLNSRIGTIEQQLGNFLTASDLDGYLKEADLATKVNLLITNNTVITTLQQDVRTLQNVTIPALENRLNTLYADSIAPMWSQVQTNKDSIAILKGLIDQIDLSKYYTKEEIDNNFAKLTALQDSVAKCRKDCKDYTDEQIRIVNQALAGKADASALQSLATELRNADAAMNTRIDSLAAVTSQLSAKVDAVIADVAKLTDARAKQITGIVVQQVYNPAFGSYNSLVSNVQTNMLVAYYGKAASNVTFPSNDDEEVEPYEARTGQVFMAGTGNAGAIYLTINPNDVDFSGFKGLELVNSVDEACAVKLGQVMPSNEVLTFGYTRAADNGFYVVPATLSAADIENPDLHINIDKSNVKEALSSLINVTNMASAKLALKDVAKVALETAQGMKLEAQGVKCSWQDAYGEHSVNSNYNIAAVAVQPLGFNSVDAIFDKDGNGAYWRAYGKAKGLVTKAAKKAGKSIANQIKKQMNLDKIQADIADLQTKVQNAHMNPIDPNTGEIKITTEVTVPSQTIPVDIDVPVNIKKDIEIKVPVKIDMKPVVKVPEQKVTMDTTIIIDVPVSATYDPVTDKVNLTNGKQYIRVWKDFIIPEQTVSANLVYDSVYTVKQTIEFNETIKVKKDIKTEAFKQKVTIDITKEVNDIFNSMLGDINNSFDNINDLIDALDNAMVDVNVMLDGINNLTAKLENATYLTRVYKYLDKVANQFARVTPKLFKPVLLVNSDSGLGLAGFEGAPSTVSGTVEVIPTTYSAELLAPIFKRYIRVNDNAGQILEGSRSLDITSQLKPGVNTIEYRALDYQGNEWAETYQIVR